MTFAAGWFLLGSALIALPIVLHRINQRTPAETTVSSLLLMREADEPVRVRRTLAHLVLLAVRIALLVAAVLAFAQPLLDGDVVNAGDDAAELLPVVVLDSSLSMGRDGLWTDVMREVAAIDTRGNARFVAAGSELTLVTDVALVEPTAARLDFERLATRLDGIINAMPETETGVEVHVVSDFQASAVPSQINALVEGASWPMILHRVGTRQDNWAVESIQASSDSVRVGVASYASRAREVELTVARDGELLHRRKLTLDAGEKAVELFELAPIRRGDAAISASLDVSDALAADDVRRAVQVGGVAASLPVVAQSTGSVTASRNVLRDAFDYLAAAVTAAELRFEPISVEAEEWRERSSAAVILDPGELGSLLQRQVERHIEAGGGVLLIAGERTQAAGSIPIVGSGVEPRPFETERVVHRVVADDSTHPVARATWPQVEVYRALTLTDETPGEVLLRLDDGRPLLVEHAIGKGRLLVLLTMLDRDWNSLVVRPAFVEFVAHALSYLAQDLGQLRLVSGEAFSIPASSAQLFDASGDRVLGLGSTGNRPVVRLTDVGFYELRTPGRRTRVAVNPDPRESDLTPTQADLLARWEEATRALDRQRAPVERAESSQTQQWPLAPWLLILLAVLVLVEPVIANWGRSLKEVGTRVPRVTS